MRSLDIHGLVSSEAHVKIGSFIKEGFINREHFIVIIHGNGKKILQKKTHEIAESSKYVHRYEYAPPQYGGTGATIIYLNKRGINGQIINI